MTARGRRGTLRARRPAVPSSRDVTPLIEAFAATTELPQAERETVAAHVRVREHPARSWLLRVGERCDWLAFVVRGLVRHVRFDGEREVDLGFDLEGRFVTDTESFLTGAPASRAIETLEPTRLLVMKRADLDALRARDACWERVSRKLLEAAMLRKQRKEDDLRLRSPESRWRRMVERRPYLLGRVPLHHLASYLGMAPETLSRIRTRLARNRS